LLENGEALDLQGSPIWDYRTRVSVHARCEALTWAHHAREVGVLKRYDVGEGESELGADFTPF
jgi:hypothetical protein